MILSKLQEALAEVPAQRVALNTALDEVESQLRSMIAKLSGMPEAIKPAISSAPPVVSARPAAAPVSIGERDGIDDIADILRAEGKPLHITAIAEKLSQSKGEEILRTKIEPGMNRHVAKAKRLRIDKFGPSIFGLPEWKQRQQPALTQIAS